MYCLIWYKQNFLSKSLYTSPREKIILPNHKLFCNIAPLKIKTMYAIVEIAGQQFKVEEGQKIYTHRLKANEGENIDFEKILLVDNNGDIKVGNPLINGKVSAKVLKHLKGDKILVFKKKRRKGYQKLNGHRQYLSYIQIEKINV